MNHAVFYGSVQARFLDAWASFARAAAAGASAPGLPPGSAAFGGTLSTLAGWLLEARVPVARRRPRERLARAEIAGLILVEATAPADAVPGLDRKQAAVANALDWLYAVLPPTYVEFHVFVFPPFQLHCTLGGDADLSPMMLWTPPPYLLRRALPAAAAVARLWRHATEATEALVDGGSTPAVRAALLRAHDRYATRAAPRYACVAAHHRDFFRYRLPILAADHGVRRSGSTFALFLNTRSREHPKPFSPLNKVAVPSVETRAADRETARAAVAGLAGDVVGYLESTLANERANSFGFTLFPLA